MQYQVLWLVGRDATCDFLSARSVVNSSWGEAEKLWREFTLWARADGTIGW